MKEPWPTFYNDSLALLAQQVAELSAYVGSVNALLSKLDNPEIAAEAREMNKRLTELHTGIARLADAFPPPVQDLDHFGPLH